MESARPTTKSFFASPWVQLIIGVICMVMIANLQYGWTFFVPDIQKKFGWDRASIQVAFTLFVLFETWLVPIEGWFVDKYGPRIVIFVGGVLCGIAWIMNSFADSLAMFYAAQVIGGIGRAGYTAPASAMRSNGSRVGAVWPLGLRLRALAPARR